MSTEEKSVSTKEVLEMLHNGKTRKDINAALGLSFAEGRVLWNTPSLKGRKTVPQVNLKVVDDIPAKPAPATTSSDAAVAETTNTAPVAVQAEEIPATEEVESAWDRKSH